MNLRKLTTPQPGAMMCSHCGGFWPTNYVGPMREDHWGMACPDGCGGVLERLSYFSDQWPTTVQARA